MASIHVNKISNFVSRIVKNVSNFVLHPYFNYTITLMNDIALIMLSSPVDLATYTPVCLPAAGTDYAGKNAWVYGMSLVN